MTVWLDCLGNGPLIKPESWLGCAARRLGRLQVCPEGTTANSPRFQPGETGPTPPRLSPEGTTVIQSPITQCVCRRIAHCRMIPIDYEAANFRRPAGTSFECSRFVFARLKPGAICCCPCGTFFGSRLGRTVRSVPLPPPVLKPRERIPKPHEQVFLSPTWSPSACRETMWKES
jgi:hypothetical protein